MDLGQHSKRRDARSESVMRPGEEGGYRRGGKCWVGGRTPRRVWHRACGLHGTSGSVRLRGMCMRWSFGGARVVNGHMFALWKQQGEWLRTVRKWGERYDAPLSLVTQHCIRVAQCLKPVLCRGVLIDVWMELLAELNDLAG